MEMLIKSPCPSKQHVGALIISPTRELASQIKEVVDMFARHLEHPTSVLLLTGGTNPQEDVDRLRKDGCNIIVATPGRLWDVFRRLPDLSGLVRGLEVLVLDEADRLLALGFREKLTEILGRLPKQRRTVCYEFDGKLSSWASASHLIS